MIEYEYHIIDVDDRVKNDMLCSVKVSKVKNTEVNCSNIVCSNDELCIFRGSNSLLSMWFVVVVDSIIYVEKVKYERLKLLCLICQSMKSY